MSNLARWSVSCPDGVKSLACNNLRHNTVVRPCPCHHRSGGLCGGPYLSVRVGEPVIEEATGEASKAQVGTESCGTSQERVGVQRMTGPVHRCLETLVNGNRNQVTTFIVMEQVVNLFNRSTFTGTIYCFHTRQVSVPSSPDIALVSRWPRFLHPATLLWSDPRSQTLKRRSVTIKNGSSLAAAFEKRLFTLTKLFQGRNSKLVVMVFFERCGTSLKHVRSDRLHRQVDGAHLADEGLEALVCERRLSTVNFYDPGRSW